MPEVFCFSSFVICPIVDGRYKAVHMEEIIMKPKNRRPWNWFVLVVVLSVTIGCSQVMETEPVIATPIATPSTAPLDATALPTNSPAADLTPTPASIGTLTAKEIVVRRFRNNTSFVELQKEDGVEVQEEDRITVENKGRGELRFLDDLVVEIFHDSELHISEAALDPQGFILVRLQQVFGTTRAELNKEANARIQLETEYATIKSLNTADSDVDFVVCQAKPVTCMVTLSGEVEVEALGEVVTVGAGEASYVFPGEPPSPAICADMAETEEWVEMYRNGEEVIPLGKIVAGWPQEPCPDESQVALPSSELMVNIPEGQFEIGDVAEDEFHSPVEQIMLDSFWIDIYEVTNAGYQNFLGETGRVSPAGWPGGVLPAGQENYPIKGVTWDDAFAYCSWEHKRLPAEAEWEVAARGPGPEPALYPWGSDPGADGQVFDLPRTDTHEVGSATFNVSPYGVYDMAGNVWEWVGEPYGPIPDGDYILRGGRHGLLKDMAFRQPAVANDMRFVPFAGFRCAADLVEGE